MLELPERHTTLTTEMRALTQRMDALTVEVRAFVEATNRRLDNIDSRLDRMEGDNASLKGFGAEYRAGVEIANIVEHLGKTWIRTLGRDEIVGFERAANIQGIPRAHLLSYRSADIIAEATDEDGATCYVVVEVSYTTNGRDTTRATRSAGLLSRFTGINASPYHSRRPCGQRHSRTHRRRANSLLRIGRDALDFNVRQTQSSVKKLRHRPGELRWLFQHHHVTCA